MFIEKQNEMY